MVGKYTKDTDYRFRLSTEKDMIPITWPDTMDVKPVINKLNKEHTEVQKLANANPHLSYCENSDNYYKKKREYEAIKLAKQQKEGKRRI